jgi:hypothetical protein
MLTVGFVVIGVVLGGLAFFRMYRPWQLRWGATLEELSRTMPGDEVVSAPAFNAMRAVTVEAPPEAIWPWIVQIGFWRAGWYSYDLLDNAGRRSAERIMPELQHMEVGDLVPMGPGKNAGIWVKGLEQNRWMLWADKFQLTTWAWALEPEPDGSTRLLTRVRARPSWRHPTTAAWLLLVEVADFPMMRKCLLGIKRRAEALVPRPVSAGGAPRGATEEPVPCDLERDLASSESPKG